jgi:hypothetical protein
MSCLCCVVLGGGVSCLDFTLLNRIELIELIDVLD